MVKLKEMLFEHAGVLILERFKVITAKSFINKESCAVVTPIILN